MTTADLTRLHERIDDLAAGIGEIRENVARVMPLCPRHDAAIKEVRLVLQGAPEDGKSPGLIGRVAALETWRKAVGFVLAALWTVIVGYGAIALEALIR